MTHDELLHEIDMHQNGQYSNAQDVTAWDALRAVVELHKPYELQSGYIMCELGCNDEGGYAETYPCKTIQAIKKELK